MCGGNEIPEGLTDKERLILDIISKGEFDSIRGVSERLSISHGAVERVMKSLVSKKLIERRGSDKSGS
jgi:DNA-binding MarR family transcriptional regulator